MQTVSDAVVDAVNQHETEQEKKKFFTSVLIELSTRFPRTFFADCIEGMDEYWAEQGEASNIPCVKLLVKELEAGDISFNSVGDIINQDFMPAWAKTDADKQQALTDLFTTLCVYYPTEIFGPAFLSAFKHLGALEASK